MVSQREVRMQAGYQDSEGWYASRYDFSKDASCELSAISSRPQAFANDREIRRIGDTPTETLIVEQGCIARFALARSGRRQVLAFYVAGELVDIGAVVDDNNATGLLSYGDTIAWSVHNAGLRQLALSSLECANWLWREQVIETARMSRQIFRTATLNAAARLCNLFAEIATRTNANLINNGVALAFSLSQTQIGEIVGLTSVHVNRTLRVLRESGIVSMKDGGLTIFDWQKLTRIGEFTLIQTDNNLLKVSECADFQYGVNNSGFF